MVSELSGVVCHQMAKQKNKEEQEKRLLDQRAKFIEKTKNLLHFEPISEDKPRKSGGKVRCDWSGCNGYSDKSVPLYCRCSGNISLQI